MNTSVESFQMYIKSSILSHSPQSPSFLTEVVTSVVAAVVVDTAVVVADTVGVAAGVSLPLVALVLVRAIAAAPTLAIGPRIAVIPDLGLGAVNCINSYFH